MNVTVVNRQCVVHTEDRTVDVTVVNRQCVVHTEDRTVNVTVVSYNVGTMVVWY